MAGLFNESDFDLIAQYAGKMLSEVPPDKRRSLRGSLRAVYDKLGKITMVKATRIQYWKSESILISRWTGTYDVSKISLGGGCTRNSEHSKTSVTIRSFS